MQNVFSFSVPMGSILEFEAKSGPLAVFALKLSENPIESRPYSSMGPPAS